MKKEQLYKDILNETRNEINQIIDDLTNINESEDFGNVARRLLDLRKMLKQIV